MINTYLHVTRMNTQSTKYMINDTEGFHVLTHKISHIFNHKIISFFILYFPSFLLFNQFNFNPFSIDFKGSLEKI